ncbi:MAG: Ig-like domain-containing protein [Acidobacteriota bacterium]|nr:Ig-like domain-containing protein [Acidobacteriota bacterium]
MLARYKILVALFVGLALVVAGCSSSGLDGIQVNPSSQALAVGQTAPLTVTATYGAKGHQSTSTLTSGITWTSSAPAVATVSSLGVVTALSAGTATITATATAFNGPTSSTSTITVTGAGSSTVSGSVVTLAVVPGAQSVASPSQTTQFLAIGTTSSGATVNLTNQVAWSSSSTQIATIGGTTGFATAVGQGTATISALFTNATSGTVVTGTATFTVLGGTTEQFTAISITPGAQSLSASGQTGQFIALGTSGTTGLQSDVTSSPQISWKSAVPSIATVSASGLVTGVSVGSTTITAELTNPDNSVVSNTATVTVSQTSAPEPLLSLQIIPSSITVGNLQDTGQFLAIGTFSTAPFVRDVTNSPNVNWLTSSPSVFPVNTNSGGSSSASAGLVTAYGAGSATIIAEVTNPTDGTIQTATATFNCPTPTNPPQPGQCYQGSQAFALLSTLTVYNEGLNTTDWQVTAASATGTANVLHCGPGWSLGGGAGGSVCVATYPLGTSIVLKASGSNFGGWSYNCVPSDALGNVLSPATISAAGPNYCVVTFSQATSTKPANTNVTVGAIFN